jgi:hypothetical protein
MRNAMILALTMIALLTTATSHAADAPKPGDMVSNPPYAHWVQFPVGTAVTVKEAVTLADGAKVETIVTSKLVAKNKNLVQVETVAVAGETSQKAGLADATKTVTDYPAKVKFERTHSPDTAGYSVTEGKEMLDVGGKEAEAEWVEATATNGDETVVEKIWTVRDIPGGIVKQTITKTKGGKVVSQSSTGLVKFSGKPETKK